MGAERSQKVVSPLLTSLFFSGSFVAAEYTTADLGPLTTSLLRYVVALGFLSALALLGLFGIVGYHYFFFSSLRYTEVASTAIINALSPVVTGVLAALFLGERLSARSYFGIGLSFAGVIVLLARGDLRSLTGQGVNRGDLLMLVSVISWAVYALMIRKLVQRYSSFTLTWYATLFGVLQLALLALPERPLQQVGRMSGRSIGSVIYMGLFASGLGYLLYNRSIAAIGPTRTASFVYSVVPVLVAVLALAFFAESVTPAMTVGAALIVLGLNFALREKGRSTEAA